MYSVFAVLLILSGGVFPIRSQLNDQCVTSTNRIGRCVLVRDCPFVLKIIRTKSPTYEEIEFTENNKCGEIKSNSYPLPLVCCPLIGNVADCGVATMPGRIFGGEETEPGLYPWAGVIEYINRRRRAKDVQCGCVLIHHRWVLTAAHCITGVPRHLSVNAVRFNDWNIRKQATCADTDDIGTCRVVYEVEDQFPHPSYSRDDPNMRYDIGILKTKDDVVITKYVIPICLPYSEIIQNLPIADTPFVVTGWGQTDQDTAGRQRHVQLLGRNNSMCDVAFESQNIQLTNDQLCIGGQAKEDSCRGDSGGPLMYDDGLVMHLIGIVSFGASECGTADHPGVYTRVASFLDWIEEMMIEY